MRPESLRRASRRARVLIDPARGEGVRRGSHGAYARPRASREAAAIGALPAVCARGAPGRPKPFALTSPGAKRAAPSAARFDHASVSAQMFLAHANAKSPSIADIAGETPPEPGTVTSVFFSLSYWCTEHTCTTSLSVMKL